MLLGKGYKLRTSFTFTHWDEIFTIGLDKQGKILLGFFANFIGFVVKGLFGEDLENARMITLEDNDFVKTLKEQAILCGQANMA